LEGDQYARDAGVDVQVVAEVMTESRIRGDVERARARQGRDAPMVEVQAA
jgi:hypothetical protein